MLQLSGILQCMLHMNNILELLLKYHFHTFLMSNIYIALAKIPECKEDISPFLWAVA